MFCFIIEVNTLEEKKKRKYCLLIKGSILDKAGSWGAKLFPTTYLRLTDLKKKKKKTFSTGHRIFLLTKNQQTTKKMKVIFIVTGKLKKKKKRL